MSAGVTTRAPSSLRLLPAVNLAKDDGLAHLIVITEISGRCEDFLGSWISVDHCDARTSTLETTGDCQPDAGRAPVTITPSSEDGLCGIVTRRGLAALPAEGVESGIRRIRRTTSKPRVLS